MSRLLGPSSVVVFSLTIAIYSMSRTFLNSLSQAMGPEILELYGRRSWKQLHKLYDLSERAVFALTPVVSLGTFAVTPILMGVWLHKPALYDARVCLYMALISGVMGIKEHKYVFQTSANEHSAMARFVFLSYLGMVSLSIPALHWFRASGFLVVWLVAEIVQLAYILQLNQRLFALALPLDMRQVYRACGLLTAASACCMAITIGFASWRDPRAILMTALTIAVSGMVGYSLFEIGELRDGLLSRVQRKA